MIKKITFFALAALLLASCGTTKKTATTEPEEVIVAPEGIEFKTVTNYKSFAQINLPVSGNGFSQKENLNKVNDNGEVVPEIKLNSKPVSFLDTFYDTEGNLDEQLEVLKKKRLNGQIKENSEVKYEKMKLGNYDVLYFEVRTKKVTGTIGLDCGYLVQHNNKAACIGLFYASFSPSQIESIKSTLDETFQYVIKTVKFKS